MGAFSGRRWIMACAACLSMVAAACGDAGSTTEPTGAGTVPDTGGPDTGTPTSDLAPTSAPAQGDDPYGVLAVDWPTTIPTAARLLDRLPMTLADEERTGVFAANGWFTIGNIPILANAYEEGRVLTGYGREHLDRVVIAQPAVQPLFELWGFLVWGGAPDKCIAREGTPGLVHDGDFDRDAIERLGASDEQSWIGCTMTENPDTGNDVEAQEDWAYAFGWTAPGMAYFVAARSVEQRNELVAALITAAASDAPPSDPANPLFETDGPEVWWTGGTLVACGSTESTDGVLRYDPIAHAVTIVLAFPQCDSVSAAPDGSRLVIAGGEGLRHLTLLDLATSTTSTLTTPPPGGTLAGDSEPAWSPDGQWIALVRGANQVMIVRPDGTGLREAARGGAPSWSHDSTALLVDQGDDVVAVDLADGWVRFHLGDVESASWSPTDPAVAYIQDDALHLMSPDSGVDSVITAGLDDLGEIASPIWSPTGRYLLLDTAMLGTVLYDPEAVVVHRIGPRPRAELHDPIIWTV